MPCGYLGIGAAKMLRKLLPELFRSLGIAVIVFFAPCLIDLVDAPCGAMLHNLAVIPRAHTFLVEGNDGAVGCLVFIPCPCDAVRFREAIAVCYDGLQGFHGFPYDAVTLCIHFVEQMLVLLILTYYIGAFNNHDAVVHPLAVVSTELRQLIHTEPEHSVVCEGKYFEGYSVFEHYKKARVEIPDELFSGGDSREDLLAEMRRTNEYVASHPVEQPPEGEFATTPYDDYYELRNRLIECIPDFNIRLKTDPRTGKLEFSTDVNSVFDIAWYTLARMLSEDPLPENKGKQESRPEGIMIRCRNCGKFIIRKSNRQEYCDSEDCQKVRNARKQKAFRERKAIEKAQKQKNNKRNKLLRSK